MTKRLQKSFELLGLTDSAPVEEVKRAYRALARHYHPDRNPNHEETFKEMTSAYNRLMTHHRHRAKRAQFGSKKTARAKTPQKSRRPNVHQSPPNEKGPEQPSRRSQPDSPSDTRKKHSKRKQHSTPPRTSNLSESMPRGEAIRQWKTGVRRYQDARRHSSNASKQRTPPAPATARADVKHVDMPINPGRDSEGASVWSRLFKVATSYLLSKDDASTQRSQLVRVPINLAHLLSGGNIRIAYHRWVVCPQCIDAIQRQCSCRGSRRIKRRQELTFSIPPGAPNLARVRLSGLGEETNGDAPDGDLIIILETPMIPGFTRTNQDLFGSLTIPPSIAQKGAFLRIELPLGPVRIHLPPGINERTQLRLSGLGLPAWGSLTAGNLYLTINIC